MKRIYIVLCALFLIAANDRPRYEDQYLSFSVRTPPRQLFGASSLPGYRRMTIGITFELANKTDGEFKFIVPLKGLRLVDEHNVTWQLRRVEGIVSCNKENASQCSKEGYDTLEPHEERIMTVVFLTDSNRSPTVITLTGEITLLTQERQQDRRLVRHVSIRDIPLVVEE